MPETVMNIFDHAAFRTAELNEKVVARVDYKPELLGSLNLFEPIYSRSRTILIANTDRGLELIPTSETGAPPVELGLEPSKLRPFQTTRLAKGSTIYAESLQGVMSLPFSDQVKEVGREIADRTQRITEDMELTWEHMRLGAITGKVYDADGSTLINNWYSQWNVAEPTEINFSLTAANPAKGSLRKKLRDLKRTMQKLSKGLWTTRTRVYGLAGDEFFDALVSHPDYIDLRVNNDRTRELENIEGFSSIEIEGVTFINYRGTDDGTTLAIDTNKVKFFPVGARGAFQVAWAPAEFFPYVNQRGRDRYMLMLKDLQRDAWRRVELYSYPLFICTRPEMLLRGRKD
ncbi:major capsid protein [Devosia sp. FJ2-5-3]|uniref:major capsid protein n=1 Tax=Devosia sp. FJ2-5-3 TaxID=2976680 RepID=UPI0023D80387|nr:major capsid protein [Devosia sp. FJ2-5-3]WEJ60232.1 major capsid protein [Devosia sp. FJ2-5-3]